MGFDRTYEELKPFRPVRAPRLRLRFDRTYEELKLAVVVLERHVLEISFDRTYEELKLTLSTPKANRRKSFDRTYEELKPADPEDVSGARLNSGHRESRMRQ